MEAWQLMERLQALPGSVEVYIYEPVANVYLPIESVELDRWPGKTMCVTINAKEVQE